MISPTDLVHPCVDGGINLRTWMATQFMAEAIPIGLRGIEERLRGEEISDSEVDDLERELKWKMADMSVEMADALIECLNDREEVEKEADNQPPKK